MKLPSIEIENMLLKAHYVANEAAEYQQSQASYEWLSGVLYDLYCHFSEEGTTNEQEERLRIMGAPMLQNSLRVQPA